MSKGNQTSQVVNNQTTKKEKRGINHFGLSLVLSY